MTCLIRARKIDLNKNSMGMNSDQIRSEFPIMVDQHVLKTKDTQEILIVKTTQGVHHHEQPVYIYIETCCAALENL